MSNLNSQYWYGNIAKTRIISEVIELLDSRKQLKVFDFGCGDGGDWISILQNHPSLSLIGYEPGEASYQKAKNRLEGLSAEIYTGSRIDTLQFKADVIVSFSVFEHVVHQQTYLENARRLLAKDGVFYLNYDDGHFRNTLDLALPQSWLGAVRARVRTLLSPALALFCVEGGYQKRVDNSTADQLIASAGFQIMRVDYHNLASLKDLAKTIPEDHWEVFSRWWLDVEKDLNDNFCNTMSSEVYGDLHNLWRQMLSRTLLLKHSNQA